MNVDLPLISTPSRDELAGRCHRRHFVQNILCLRGKARDECALSVGTVIHAGAAEWWTGGKVSSAIDAARAEYDELAEWITDSRMTKEFVCDYLITKYTEQAQIAGLFEPEGWSPLSIEERVVLSLGPEATISFQLDRLVENDADGRLVLVDTKSAGRLDNRWRGQWLLNVQQKLYRYAVQKHYGRALDGHFIEGLEKSAKGTVEYMPLPPWSEGELQEQANQFVRHVQRDARLIQEAFDEDGSINLDRLYELAVTETEYNPHDCDAYGRKCELYKICTAPLDERVGLLKDGFEWVAPNYLE